MPLSLRQAIVAGLAFWTGASAAEVNFPGSAVKEVIAPNSGLRVFYVDHFEKKLGGHEMSLRLQYPDGRVDTLETFERNVDVAWSPSGKALSVTDRGGSDYADCLIIKPGRKTSGKSATKLLVNAHISEVTRDLGGDHVYVVCNGWESPDELRIQMGGNQMGGNKVPREFEYNFVYDLRSGKLRPQPTR